MVVPIEEASLYRGTSRKDKPRGRHHGLTQQKKQEIKEAFELFDTDGSGSLQSLLKLSRPRVLSVSASTTPSQRMDNLHNKGYRKFIEFPYVSAPHKKLMADLVSMLETRFDSHLLPYTLPPNVQYFQDQDGTSHASLHIKFGHVSSPIDVILGSWIHRQLPNGGALNITSLSTYLNSSTDSPNFLMDLIFSTPTSLVLILDLPPRKDLVLDPDYLQKFYEDTKLEAQRQLLEKVPEVRPYFSPSLYIRSLVSPTAILVRIESEGVERMDEIIRDHVGPVAKQVLQVILSTNKRISSLLSFALGVFVRSGRRRRTRRREPVTTERGSPDLRPKGDEGRGLPRASSDDEQQGLQLTREHLIVCGGV
ncbi:Red chlorophyll catabolite reductase [Parasponia andersonii]|uniref:Red chlorophyll catabolite reductase n=1 Tax=Parasponia andersonii TaxID=3476 RepID=A0A2P5ATC7_PARAD|nr:Red chlorophyll catabolite reductase [Parasponia andersonii]